tara:strand:- start:185 stop:385 length:201 start_codon:yes stop_codon:yes gene_type:complete
MRINIDEHSYISILIKSDNLLILSLKTRRADDSHIIISTELCEKNLDKLVSSLVLLKAEMKNEIYR